MTHHDRRHSCPRLARKASPPPPPSARRNARTLTRGELVALVRSHRRRPARRIGIGQKDAVAIVMPNGPEMAAMFVGCRKLLAAAAPLNAAYRADEFDFYLGDLQAEGAASSSAAPTRRRATSRPSATIRVIDVTPDLGGPAGAFSLSIPFADARPASALARRRRPGAAHLGHHLAAEDRAADAAQPRDLGRQHRAARWRSTPDDRSPGHHAALPHPRPDRRAALLARAPAPRCTCPPGFNALKFFA